MMSTDLLARVDDYIQSLFLDDDPILNEGLRDAAAAGLPDIQISATQGRLLYLLTKITGARRVLEVGTLGGYSTTWLARAVPADGVVISLELDERHATVARKNLDLAGVGARVSVMVGPAAQTMQRLIERRAEPFDLIFIDADKPGYPAYLDLGLQLSRAGTVILADNLIRDGAVMDEHSQDENAQAIRAFNATLAAHPKLESLIIPIAKQKVDGMSISIVK